MKQTTLRMILAQVYTTTVFRRDFVDRIGELSITRVAVWKQLLLNLCFTKVRHKCSWRRSFIEPLTNRVAG
jgi:hypothetical protein